MISFLVYLITYLASLFFKRQNELDTELDYLLYPEHVEEEQSGLEDAEDVLSSEGLDEFTGGNETVADFEDNYHDFLEPSVGTESNPASSDSPLVNSIPRSPKRKSVPSGGMATEDEVDAAINSIYGKSR